MNIFTKTKSKYINIYSLYIFFSYYNAFLNTLTFQPLLTNIHDKFEVQNLTFFYFSNQIGAYLYNFQAEISKELIIFLNSFSGNCSSRVNLIRQLLTYINKDSICILQIENPGSCFSDEIEPTITNHYLYIEEAINSFLIQHQIFQDSFHIFTEGESSLICSKIISKIKFNPKNIIHFNPINSLSSYLIEKYGLFMFFLVLPYYTHKSLCTNYNNNKKLTNSSNTNIILIMNNFNSSSRDIYLDINLPFERKKILTIEGKGLTSLIIKENQNIIKDLFNEIIIV